MTAFVESIQSPAKRPGILRRIVVSFLCSFGGWCVLGAYTSAHFYFVRGPVMTMPGPESLRAEAHNLPQPATWWIMPAVITQFAVPYIVAAWLFFVLPLFLAVDPHRKFWYRPVATFVFGLVGAVVMHAAIQFQWAPMMDSIVWFAALTGASTGFFCSIAKRRQLRG
jgi:hypothetical protein